MARELPEPPPVEVRATIRTNRQVATDSFSMVLHTPNISRMSQPGQFVQVRITDQHDPLLPRPMSIGMADPDVGTIELLYKTVGKGTRLLAERFPGESLRIVGPLGKPFRLPQSGHVYLAGGGVGMPPMRFCATRMPRERVTVVQGARSSDFLLYRDELAALEVEHLIATEDGSIGVPGLVTDLLERLLAESSRPSEVLACGPTPMLRAVAAVTRAYSIPCQVSLEEHMACGIGICMGCAVRNAKSSEPDYSLVCVDGPVFDADDVFTSGLPK